MAGELPVAIGVVAGQEGDRVLVSVPMTGFPTGFSLRAGDRVTLAAGDTELIARPLVRTRIVSGGADVAASAAEAAAAEIVSKIPVDVPEVLTHTGELMPHRERGGACPNCGTLLARTTVGGRTTYWCPRDQPELST